MATCVAHVMKKMKRKYRSEKNKELGVLTPTLFFGRLNDSRT